MSRYYIDTSDGGDSWYVMDSKTYTIAFGPYTNKVYAMNMCNHMNSEERRKDM